MDRLLPDLSHSVRRLVRAPGFTTIALLTLALGIGANTAIFSILESVVLRPLPYGDPARVVMIWSPGERGEMTWLSASEVKRYASDGGAFDQLAAYLVSAATLTGDREPERVVTAYATTNLFQTLRVRPAHGRAFLPTEGSPDPAVVILSHGLWQRRYGGDERIIGRSILVGDRPRTVVGVLPPAFRVPLDFDEERPVEMWIPTTLDDPDYAGFGNRSFIGVGRLRAGVDPKQATTAMRALEERWLRDGLVRDPISPRNAVPVQDLVLGDVRYALLVLLGAVGVILLIACANVANLMLARSDARHREIAIRTALGARRGIILQMVLKRGMVLAAIGLVIGLTGATWLTGALTSLLYGVTRFDPLTFAAAPALLAGVALVACVVPAVQAVRVSPVIALREE
jgi:putative ABC transport system permease protein